MSSTQLDAKGREGDGMNLPPRRTRPNDHLRRRYPQRWYWTLGLWLSILPAERKERKDERSAPFLPSSSSSLCLL